MSEDNDSASGRQVISRAAAVLRALAEATAREPGPDREEDGPAAHHRAPYRRGAGSAAAGRHRPPASDSARRWCGWRPRRIPTWSPPRLRRGAGAAAAASWTCACSGASTRYRSTSSPRTRNCARECRGGGHRLSDPLPAHGRPCWRAWTTRRWRAAGRAAGTPHRQHHHRAQDLLAQLAEVRTRGWALDLEEHAVGICGIGVHIETGQSEQYALSVAAGRATKGSSTPAQRPCSSARPRLNPCWPADPAALGRRRRDGRSCGKG